MPLQIKFEMDFDYLRKRSDIEQEEFLKIKMSELNKIEVILKEMMMASRMKRNEYEYLRSLVTVYNHD